MFAEPGDIYMDNRKLPKVLSNFCSVFIFGICQKWQVQLPLKASLATSTNHSQNPGHKHCLSGEHFFKFNKEVRYAKEIKGPAIYEDLRTKARDLWTGDNANINQLNHNVVKYFTWNAVTSMLIPFSIDHNASRLLINTANTKNPANITMENENDELLKNLSCKARTDLTVYKDLIDADFWFFARWARENDYTMQESSELEAYAFDRLENCKLSSKDL